MLVLLALALAALQTADAGLSPADRLARFTAALTFESGTVTIGDDIATLALPDGWAYLSEGEARRVTETLWDNDADSTVIGFIDPPSPRGRLRAPYGIVVTYEREGHIRAEDARHFDHKKLLRWMQKTTYVASHEREQLGLPGVALVGWARPPHFDRRNRRITWAKEVHFDDLKEDALNYDVRVLGREGCLTFQAVASMDDLPAVEAGMDSILEGVRFRAGHRYEDFIPGSDPLAVQGIGGLIAGHARARATRLRWLRSLGAAGTAIALLLGLLFTIRLRRKRAASI